jgi:hypothetical protein
VTRERLQDNLDFEKIKNVGQLINTLADPSHFLEGSTSELPPNLAHALAAQTHQDIQAMARAKPSRHHNQNSQILTFLRDIIDYFCLNQN